jgi:hypothetical protein
MGVVILEWLEDSPPCGDSNQPGKETKSERGAARTLNQWLKRPLLYH